jgi:hypothetical protein
MSLASNDQDQLTLHISSSFPLSHFQEHLSLSSELTKGREGILDEYTSPTSGLGTAIQLCETQSLLDGLASSNPSTVATMLADLTELSDTQNIPLKSRLTTRSVKGGSCRLVALDLQLTQRIRARV